jgi:ATP-dependent protease HslVU (ClpYQ) ATPase subunit
MPDTKLTPEQIMSALSSYLVDMSDAARRMVGLSLSNFAQSPRDTKLTAEQFKAAYLFKRDNVIRFPERRRG